MVREFVARGIAEPDGRYRPGEMAAWNANIAKAAKEWNAEVAKETKELRAGRARTA